MTRRQFTITSALAVGTVVVNGSGDLRADDTLHSKFLFELEIIAGMRRQVPSSAGMRIIVPVVRGTFTGPRLKGTIVEPSGDWIMQRSDGSSLLDVRLLLRTDDEQTIYMAWRGIATTSRNGSLNARIAPTFEAPAGRYAWLNNVVAVGVYQPASDNIHYRVFEIL